MSKYPTQEQVEVLLKCYYLGKYTLAAEIMNKTPSQIKTIEENALRSIRLAYSKSYIQGKKFESETVLYDMAERSGLSVKELTEIFVAYITGGLASEDRVFWGRIRCKGDKPTAAELLDFIFMKYELDIVPFTLE
ncbi:MAG TPA: hypothetical protein DEP23_08815 [Ruminococcaceae bacterium]|nr:hypothetical protein [Oscillospiraceae bacterium]